MPHDLFSTAAPLRLARALVRTLASVAVGGAVLGAGAQDLGQISSEWLQGALSKSAEMQTMPLRMEVQVGRLDPRLNLAPCQNVDPYLPSGSKLWGRTRIGLRCVEGAKPWNVFLPVTIQAFGPAWVLTHNVSMGEVLTYDHAMQAEFRHDRMGMDPVVEVAVVERDNNALVRQRLTVEKACDIG